MRFTLPSLALLVAATAVAADNVVTLTVPGSNDSEDSGISGFSSIRFNIAGINASTTSFVPNCPANPTATTTASTSIATDDLIDGLRNCDLTLASGPNTFYMVYKTETLERYDMGDKNATRYVTWTTTSGTSTIGTSVESSVFPITSVAFTITATAASVTPSASASASAKAGVSGSANATSTSASASASHTENAAMGLPTGHSLFAAGGAAMALALAIA
ncbi:hypothetical protein BDV33DRAFT_172746 [Aspergillus novoparasiticus]|uniref:Uncharacterized protein n=1 Tax=Aspergillus novoparasiticus TaxID=986946 RepID=A0A5N6ER66_9EURO|nr:hypothetical protein BDV33DRAFT_172746 [Aspergillus novoparasiticus]